MTLDDYNSHCGSLLRTTHVVQWGGAHVWKIADKKVFAIGGWNDGDALAVTFKVTPLSFEILAAQDGCRPAPYLASRGMSWIQRTSDVSLDDEMLKTYLTESYKLVASGLSKKLQRELGLL
jgi:predicted DNA-binding protein (MmcQ/YjbR family)